MDAILWAAAIPIILIIILLVFWIGLVVLAVVLFAGVPIGLIWAGITIGGPVGGILILLCVIILGFYYKEATAPPPPDDY